MAGRIDTHIHALPPPYVTALNAAGGDPSGWTIPDWTPEAAVKFMDSLGTSLGILSVSTPGVPIAGTGPEARSLVRNLNELLGSYAEDATHENRLGFFGTLPDWQDVEGTVAEIDYLYSEQRLCSGVTVYTTYGDMLLGNETFKPIWVKLQHYNALVFIHPGNLNVTPKLIGDILPQPVVEYPLATTRTAVDLVLKGVVRDCPDVDIILSHAGGTLPFIGTRALGGLMIPAIASRSAVSFPQAKEDFDRFYYDIALSTSDAQLDGLLDWTSPDHILFGSDFPYVPPDAIRQMVGAYDEFVKTNPRGSKIAQEVLRRNALTLLEKHSQGRTFPHL